MRSSAVPVTAVCAALVLHVLSALALAAATPAAVRTPEETVRQYLAALKGGDFGGAYDMVSHGMAQHKNRDDWAKEQQWTMQMSEAKIFDYQVYPGRIEGERALVPNVLHSQDKFLNQLGVPEYELYTLIREDGQWRINQQQLVERSDQAKWFPAKPGAAPGAGSTPEGAATGGLPAPR